MRGELAIYIATAPDGEELPALTGVACDVPIEIISIVRAADQIRLIYRRPCLDIRNPRALLSRGPRPLLA